MTTITETTQYPVKSGNGWLIGPPQKIERAGRIRKCSQCGQVHAGGVR